MNETDSDLFPHALQRQQRARLIPVYFEVHLWPHDGRILIVNKEPHRASPILTWLQVAYTDGVPIGDATVAIAHGIAASVAFETPNASVVLHDRYGNMLASPAGLGLPVTRLRRAL